MYLVYGLFSALLGLAMSVLIRLELAAPGVGILHNDNQLYNSAPFNNISPQFQPSVVEIDKVGNSDSLTFPNDCWICYSTGEIRKASGSASWGQPIGENSTPENPSEIIEGSYKLYGEVNELLQTCNTGLSSGPYPDIAFGIEVSVLAFSICIVCYWFGQSIEWVVSNNHNAWEHLSSYNERNNWNSGSPEGEIPRGDGAFVVAQRRSNKTLGLRSYSTKAKVSSTSKPDVTMPAGIEMLRQLAKQNFENANHINTEIMQIISHIDVLIAAYTLNKSKPGNETPGTDNETLDGINIKYFEKLQKELRTGIFSFRPSRRMEIPKANGQMRPLSIASPRDKLVQTAMKMVLEAVFESTFSTHSHGFRPKRSCHSALGEIKRTFTAVN